MNFRQNGFSTALMSLFLLGGALTAFTVNEFNSFLSKARVAEAFHVADEARLRITEFYLLSDRFPSSEPEVEALTRTIAVPSGYVREIVLEPSYAGHDVALKVYLDDESIAGNPEASPFVFIAGDVSKRGGRSIEWSCGAHGVDAKLLPGGCVTVDG
jgi:hypothetical protein